MSYSPNYDRRRNLLIDRLDGATLLVSNLVNVRYLTGFTGSNAFLIVGRTNTLLLTDGRYTTQVATECPDLETLIRPVDSSMIQLVCTALADLHLSACMIESDAMTRGFWKSLNDLSGDALELIDSSGIVESLRSIKDESELAAIRKSVEINEQAFLSTLEAASREWTELEFAWHLEREIRALGGEGFSFDPIVAAGPSSALPHYHPSSARLGEHNVVLVDWGTSYSGYASDLTRMIHLGDVPSEIAEIHEVVAAAKHAATACVRDGVDLLEVDSAARDLITDAGFGEHFNHGLGHSFGLEIHESPFLSPAFRGQLTAGMVITIEPGIYLAGLGGVRLEDDILVTENGFERLNCLPDKFFGI